MKTTPKVAIGDKVLHDNYNSHDQVWHIVEKIELGEVYQHGKPIRGSSQNYYWLRGYDWPLHDRHILGVEKE